KQGLKVLIAALATRAIEVQVLPIADPGHELDPQQVREPEDGLTLPVGIGVHRIRPDVGRVLRDKIEDMMPLPGPTGNKAREEGNVGIRNEIVTNSPIPTVA